MNYESENIEFKSQFTDDIYKEVIAFANTDGGIIYVGIDDKGDVVGIKDIDEEYTRITNGIRDAIMPDVTMFVRFKLQDNKVVSITVSEGTNKPYYLRGKGPRPLGVFVRQGTSTVSASPEQIRRMIKENDGYAYEEEVSTQQELTFDATKKAFKMYDVEFSSKKYHALGLLHSKSRIYTNLALILSDQCVHTTKIAVFSDDAQTVFRDSKEFAGSIFKQFEETITYLALCNKTKATIKGVVRHESHDYPEEAIREALLNALVHRDYSFSGSIIINVTDNQMEFISLGGLLPGLSCDDICTGISEPRNKKLAEIFHRLRLIESYGTGIRRIFHLYSDCDTKPTIDVTPNTFKITLPNMNAHAASRYALDDQRQRVLEYIDKHGKITDSNMSKILKTKSTRTYMIAREMCELGLIKKHGRGIQKYYTK